MNHVFDATPEAVGELLPGGGEFLTPERMLSDLTPEMATAIFANSPYTIAQIISHLHYWQERVLARLRGDTEPRPAHLAETFAPVAPDDWDSLRQAFFVGLEQCTVTAERTKGLTSLDRTDTSQNYDLAESALHNGYHLGQIALLRQMLGFWEPEGGDDSW